MSSQVNYKLYQINARRAAVSHKVNSGETIDKQSHSALLLYYWSN